MTDPTLTARDGTDGQKVSAGISVVINTLNEESDIGDCIDSVKGLADEIVVCDMDSDDRTVQIARERGARIVGHSRVGFVEPARKFAVSSARREWVLVLDADERMTDLLATRLKEVVQEDACDVVSFWSLYWYFGGWVHHGGFFHDQWRRFFRRGIYLETYSDSDELVHHNFRSLLRAKRILRLPREYYITHYAYPTVEKYLSKTLGAYARIEGEQYARSGRRFSLVRMIGEPIKEFGTRFLWKKGYLDGVRGFVLACLYAGFRFCVWANVWFLENKKDG